MPSAPRPPSGWRSSSCRSAWRVGITGSCRASTDPYSPRGHARPEGPRTYQAFSLAVAVKGVVLAGGKATRLLPLTHVTNKHLLPVYDKPLIYYPLEAMARAGVEEVLVITNPEHAGHFLQLLRTGSDFGLKLTYELQEQAGGLAQAVGLAEPFARGS